MAATRTIDVDERRARLGRRHHLAGADRAASVAQVARSLVGIHSTDPVSVFLAARARMADSNVSTIEDELYESRSVVRILGMRRTLFVEPLDLAPVVLAGCSRAVAARERRRTIEFLRAARIADDPAAWLRELEASALQALIARGDATTSELNAADARLAQQLTLGQGRRYEVAVSVGSRVLPLLAVEGLAVRGRPRGTWINGQYRWFAIDRWIPGGFPDMPTEAAQVELIRHWLRAFGPGTLADIRWWTGLTGGEVKRALLGLRPVEVALGGGTTGLVLPEDAEAPTIRPEPWVALLPALDPTVMGWTERGWYLGGHARVLFDTNGNAGPTIWWDGRVVGGWAQRRDGEIALRLLEDVGRDAELSVAVEAERLRTWLGAVRFTPRFRTPLERELSA